MPKQALPEKVMSAIELRKKIKATKSFNQHFDQ